MIRTLTASLLLVFALPSRPQPQKSALETPVKGLEALTEVSLVVEELSPDAQAAGLADNELKAQAIVTIKRNLPGLKINDTAISFLHLNVLVLQERNLAGYETGYAACIHVQVFRPALILPNSAIATPSKEALGLSFPVVWHAYSLVVGSRASIAKQVKDEIETHLTKFVADYYQQNGR